MSQVLLDQALPRQQDKSEPREAVEAALLSGSKKAYGAEDFQT